MSFIGSIGELMNSTGLEELVGASFGGLASIFNGKAWPKAMRSFRMVMYALLHEFLKEGEKESSADTGSPGKGKTVPSIAKDDLLARSHVCRHSDGAPAVSADMFGEQTYIRQGKGAGGMKGISTNPEQVAVWIQSFCICSHLSQSLDDMYSDTVASEKTVSNRHKEEGEARRELDAEDRSKIVRMLWENTNPLMTESTLLYHIINGQVADEKVNVQDVLKIGHGYV